MNDSTASSARSADVRERFEHSLIAAFFIAFTGIITAGAVAGTHQIATAVSSAIDDHRPRRQEQMIKNPKKDSDQQIVPRPAVASSSLERPLPVFTDDHADIPDEVAEPTAEDIAEIGRNLRISRLQGAGDWDR